MIEILPNVFYDPAKEWYEQDLQLIELAETVMQQPPLRKEMEAFEQNIRLLWGEWEHTTELGLFLMRVDMLYMFPIDDNAFQRKRAHDKVTVSKIE